MSLLSPLKYNINFTEIATRYIQYNITENPPFKWDFLNPKFDDVGS